MMSLRLPEVVAAASAVSISLDCAALGAAPRPAAPSTAAAPIAEAPAIRPRRVGDAAECGVSSAERCAGSELSSVERRMIESDTVDPPEVAGGSRKRARRQP